MKISLFRCIGLALLTGMLATQAAAFTPPAGIVERAQMGQWVYQPAQQTTVASNVEQIDIGHGITLALPEGCCRYYDQEETARLLAGTRLMAPDTVSFGATSGAWVVTLNTQSHTGAAPDINRQIGPFVSGTTPHFIHQSGQGNGYWLNEFTEETRRNDHTFIRHVAVFSGHDRIVRAELIAPQETYAQSVDQFEQILRNLRFGPWISFETLWKQVGETHISLLTALQFLAALMLLRIVINLYRSRQESGGPSMAKRLGRYAQHKSRISPISLESTLPSEATHGDSSPDLIGRISPFAINRFAYPNTGTAYARASTAVTQLEAWQQPTVKYYTDEDQDQHPHHNKYTFGNKPEDREGYGKLKLPPRKNDTVQTEPAKILYIGIGTKGIHTLNRAMRSDIPGVDFMAIGHDQPGNVMDLSPAYLKLREDPECTYQELMGRGPLWNNLHQMMRAYKLIVVVADSYDNICVCYVPFLAEIARKHNHLLTVMLTMSAPHTLSMIREQPFLQRVLQQTGISHICFTGPMMRRVLGSNLNSRQLQLVRMSWINMTIWAYAQLASDELSLQSLKRRLQRGKQGYFAYKGATGNLENGETLWDEAAEKLVRSPFLADSENFGGRGILIAVSNQNEPHVELGPLKQTVERRVQISTTREICIPEMKGNDILLLLSYLYY